MNDSTKKTFSADNQVADQPMIVNDDRLDNGAFAFAFTDAWVHETGHGVRFEGGDEHWTNTQRFGDAYPSFTFRFVGSHVALYGHKAPSGAIADVTVDGVAALTITTTPALSAPSSGRATRCPTASTPSRCS